MTPRGDALLFISIVLIFLILSLMVYAFLYIIFLSCDKAGDRIPKFLHVFARSSHASLGIIEDYVTEPIGVAKLNGPTRFTYSSIKFISVPNLLNLFIPGLARGAYKIRSQYSNAYHHSTQFSSIWSQYCQIITFSISFG